MVTLVFALLTGLAEKFFNLIPASVTTINTTLLSPVHVGITKAAEYPGTLGGV
jgi:hypothetical protein